MKQILSIMSIAIMVTGCSTVEQVVKHNFAPSVELAKDECAKMGFKHNTNNYQMCVMRQTDSIRNARVQNSISSRANRSRDVICQPWGNGVRCEEW